MGMIKEFREFALKGNVLDLAVGVIIGGAFGGIVTSLINDIIMPPIGLLLGKVDFKDLKMVIQKADATATPAVSEVAISYGNFITILLNFIILAFCIFMVVKLFNAARKRFEEQKPAPAPAGPTPSEKLLAEIRDELRKR